jgi:hypothetical protein
VSSAKAVGRASETEVVVQLLPGKTEACRVTLVSVFVSAALKMEAAGWTETTELPTKQHEDYKITVCTVTVGRVRRFHMD